MSHDLSFRVSEITSDFTGQNWRRSRTPPGSPQRPSSSVIASHAPAAAEATCVRSIGGWSSTNNAGDAAFGTSQALWASNWQGMRARGVLLRVTATHVTITAPPGLWERHMTNYVIIAGNVLERQRRRRHRARSVARRHGDPIARRPPGTVNGMLPLPDVHRNSPFRCATTAAGQARPGVRGQIPTNRPAPAGGGGQADL